MENCFPLSVQWPSEELREIQQWTKGWGLYLSYHQVWWEIFCMILFLANYQRNKCNNSQITAIDI